MKISIVFMFPVIFFFACFPADKQIEAAGGYAAQQYACIDRYATKENIDRCRDAVKRAWATDGGKDGSHD